MSVCAEKAPCEGAITRVTVNESAATLAMVSAGGQLSDKCRSGELLPAGAFLSGGQLGELFGGTQAEMERFLDFSYS